MSDELEIHEAFKDAGQKTGMEIWRIEKFEPVRQDPKTYGKFYSGDAYLVLHTTKMKGSSKFSYDLHFWLGKECSQDESGTAAIRTVELDSMVLNGAAVQYREVQGHESKLFLSYYKQGIQYLKGGVESGFNKVDPDEYEKRLFQCKGRKNVRVEQVECVCGSLNQGDTFILDDGPDIYVWVGPKSEKKEKLAGVEGARRLRDEEKAGRAQIHIVEENWGSDPAFFKALGSKDKRIKAANEADDEDIIRKLDQQILLYCVKQGPSEENWYEMKEIETRPLTQDLLESEYCYILDSGATGIFLWTGKLSDVAFRSKVWNAANAFLETRGYPAWMSVTRVVDGGETSLFKQYFESWTDSFEEKHAEKEEEEKNVADQDYSGADGIDVDDLHKGDTVRKAEDYMPDDGTGQVMVYKVKERDVVEVPARAHGIFFGGDCYIVLYKYEEKGRDKHIIYFWQGANASTEDKGVSAALAVVIDDKLGGEAMQVRVVMNKEPKHFLKIFKGKVIFFMDGHIDGYSDFHHRGDSDPQETLLFQARGSDDDNTRAVQVPARAASLNSNDLFVYDTPKRVYAWFGQYSGEQEKEMAIHMAQYISPDKDKVVLKEGDETQQFWTDLGGEEEYYKGQRTTSQQARVSPRLFHCSMTSGRFAVEEIIEFNQDDLEESDVMILDTYDEIFIWLGNDCREFEKKESAKTAQNYLLSDPSGRNPDNTLIIVVRQGFEPPQFTGCFLGWDPNKWAEGKSFHDLIAEVGKENAGISLLEDEVKKYTSFYALDELQRRLPPEGVDVTRKEMYLSDEDFLGVFGMSKETYLAQPEWRRIDQKKKYGLF